MRGIIMGFYSKKVMIVLAFFCLVLSQKLCANSSLIAGSSNVSPPPFWLDSFWGITSSIDRAFPFTLNTSGQFSLDHLEIAAYHYNGLAGSTATFSIAQDNNGLPGTIIDTFFFNNITTDQQVVSTLSTNNTILDSVNTYWVIGETTQGQVNWNLGDNTFGPYAFRVNDGAWEFHQDGNVSGFALHGNPIPEPTAITLITLGSLGLLQRKRSRSK